MTTQASGHEHLARWIPIASELPPTEYPASVPLEVVLDESVEVADFVERHWEPAKDRPGLRSVEKYLPGPLADEIKSLRAAVQQAQTDWLLIVEPKGPAAGLIERGRFVLGELSAVLDFVLDDDVEEPADAQLTQLREAHAGDSESAATLAQALHDYAGLSSTLRDRLAATVGLDVALIDEAKKLATELGYVRQTPAPPSEPAREALLLRNRLVYLLDRRVRRVRKAARFVFRAHPAILREATSPYERRRRAESRRRQAAVAATAAAPTASAGSPASLTPARG